MMQPLLPWMLICCDARLVDAVHDVDLQGVQVWKDLITLGTRMLRDIPLMLPVSTWKWETPITTLACWMAVPVPLVFSDRLITPQRSFSRMFWLYWMIFAASNYHFAKGQVTFLNRKVITCGEKSCAVPVSSKSTQKKEKRAEAKTMEIKINEKSVYSL